MITGRDEPISRAQCLAAGARWYLVKPIEPGRLLNAVAAVLSDAGDAVP